jgi:hypothetical protein
MKIEDGTGSGYKAKVDNQFRLSTDALTVDESVSQTFEGVAYNVNTGTINLTSANPSATLFLKNDAEDDLVITALFYLLGNTTGGSGDTLVQIIRNPTAGTIVSAGTDFEAVNRDFGSANSLEATLKKGAEGSTLTDGTVVIESIFSGVGRQTVAVGALVLRPGNSIGYIVTPPSGNTSMDTQWAMSCYMREEAD